MKVNKRISAKMLVASAVMGSTSLVGCTQTNNFSDIKSEVEVSQEIKVERVEYTGEELNKKYEAILPKVKEIYDNNGITYIDNAFDDEAYKEQFKEVKGICLTESTLDENLSSTFFTISENLDGDKNIMFCGAINIDHDSNEEYNVEETFIKDITEALRGEFNAGEVNYSEINDFVNTTLKKKDNENVSELFDYGNMQITVTVLDTVLYYININ